MTTKQGSKQLTRHEVEPAQADDADDADGAAADDRSTPVPSFDMETYARESDANIRIGDEPPARGAAPESAVWSVPPSTEVNESPNSLEAQEIYWARIGDGQQIPVLVRPLEELLREAREKGVGFVLSAIDGRSTVRALMHSCGLPPLAVLCILCELMDRGAIALER